MIDDLKEFKKFLDTCRKSGVSEITSGTFRVKFGGQDFPFKQPKSPDGQDTDTEIEMPDELTEEDLTYYSAGPNENLEG